MKTWDQWYTRDAGVRVGRHRVGQFGKLAHGFGTECCGHQFEAGDLVEIYAKHTPNKVLLVRRSEPYPGGLHNVWASHVCFASKGCVHDGQLPKGAESA